MIGLGSKGGSVELEVQLALVPRGLRVGIGLVDWVVRRDPTQVGGRARAREVDSAPNS